MYIVHWNCLHYCQWTKNVHSTWCSYLSQFFYLNNYFDLKKKTKKTTFVLTGKNTDSFISLKKCLKSFVRLKHIYFVISFQLCSVCHAAFFVENTFTWSLGRSWAITMSVVLGLGTVPSDYYARDGCTE